MTSGYIYIVSCPDRIAIHHYKIGLTTTNQEKLLVRYRTPLIDPRILLYLECKDCRNAENEIKTFFKDTRVKVNRNKGKDYISEWVVSDCLKDLIDEITKIVEIHNGINPISYQGLKYYKNIGEKYELIDDYIDFNNDDYKYEDMNTLILKIVKSFQELSQFTQIEKIVITDKIKLTGYLKFKGSIWYKLDSEMDNNENPETLATFIKQNYKDDLILCNICNISLFECKLHSGDYKRIIPKFIWSQIIYDIANNYYDSLPIFYNLQDHEFIIYESGNPMKDLNQQILNIKSGTFTDIPKYSILLENKQDFCSSFPYMRNPDTSIIAEILNIYVKNYYFDNFKKFVQSLFFRSEEFYIYEDQYPCFSLARLLIIFMDKLRGYKTLYNFYNFRDTKISLKCNILIPSNMGKEKYPYTKTIIKLQKIGTKKIIIFRKDLNLYNIESCYKYIIDNYTRISDNFSDKDMDLSKFNIATRPEYREHPYKSFSRGIWLLFENSKYLFPYALHWFINLIKE